jgi:hypothetical protein
MKNMEMFYVCVCQKREKKIIMKRDKNELVKYVLNMKTCMCDIKMRMERKVSE